MEAAKKNADRLNLVGIVVIGVCGAVLIYVSIILLQAFYVNDSAEIVTMADYGGQDAEVKSVKATQMNNITQVAHNAPAEGKPDTFRIGIDHAMELVIADAKKDPSNLVPSVAPSTTPTIKPIFGRPQKLDPVAPPAADAAGSGSAAPAGDAAGSAAPAAGSGSAAPAAGAGSAAPAAAPAAPAAGSAAPAPVAPARGNGR